MILSTTPEVHWSATSKLFVKVMPRDYRRVLEGKSQFKIDPTAEQFVLAGFGRSTSEVVHG